MLLRFALLAVARCDPYGSIVVCVMSYREVFLFAKFGGFLFLMYNTNMYLCVDIGGTKTLVAGFSRGGRKLFTKKFPTAEEPERFIGDLGRATRWVPKRFIEVVSVAVPGVVEKNRSVKYGNLAWGKFDLREKIEELFGGVSVNMINDADVAALYEAQRYFDKTVLYITLSTGIGAGLVEEGKLSRASAKLEPGHKKYRFRGKVKEWEDIASAAAVREAYGQSVTTLKDQAIFDDVAVRISLGLSDLIRKYQPEVVVFGGPLAIRLQRYAIQLKRLLAEELKAEVGVPRMVRARRPTESVIYGLYLYAIKK